MKSPASDEHPWCIQTPSGEPQRAAAWVWRGLYCKGIPLNLVLRWLGHAPLSTTAIYAYAVGEEERHIAARLWT